MNSSSFSVYPSPLQLTRAAVKCGPFFLCLVEMGKKLPAKNSIAVIWLTKKSSSKKSANNFNDIKTGTPLAYNLFEDVYLFEVTQ